MPGRRSRKACRSGYLSPKNKASHKEQCPMTVPGREEKMKHIVLPQHAAAAHCEQSELRLLVDLIDREMNDARERIITGWTAMHSKPATINPVQETGDGLLSGVSQYCYIAIDAETIRIPRAYSARCTSLSEHGNRVDEGTASNTSSSSNGNRRTSSNSISGPNEKMESPHKQIFHPACSEDDAEDVSTANGGLLCSFDTHLDKKGLDPSQEKMEAKEGLPSEPRAQDDAPSCGGDDSVAKAASVSSNALACTGDALRVALQDEVVEIAKEKSLQATGGEQYPHFDSIDDAAGVHDMDGSADVSTDRQVENRNAQLQEKETDEQAPLLTGQPQPYHAEKATLLPDFGESRLSTCFPLSSEDEGNAAYASSESGSGMEVRVKKREKAARLKDKREQEDRFSSEAESAADWEDSSPLAEDGKTALRKARKTELPSTGAKANSGQPPTRNQNGGIQAKRTPRPTVCRQKQTSSRSVSLFSSLKRRSLVVNVCQPARGGVSWVELLQHEWHGHLLPQTHPSPTNLIKRYTVQHNHPPAPLYDRTAPQDQDGQSKAMAIVQRHHVEFCECMPGVRLAEVCRSKGLLTLHELEQVASAAIRGSYEANMVFLSFIRFWDSNMVMFLQHLLCSGAPPWVSVVFDTCIGVQCELPRYHDQL